MRALADPARRAVVDLLRGGPRPAGEIAASIGMTPAALSRHLRVLRATGMVEAAGAQHDARLRLYQLRQEPFVALQAWLDQVNAFWGEQLSAFRSHVERRPR